MSEIITRAVENVLANPKTGPVVATAAVGIGGAEIFDILRDGLGLVAVVAGIYLTVILIRKNRLELQMMEEKRLAAALKREEKGLPVRRSADKK